MNALLNLGKYIWGIAFLGFAFVHFMAGEQLTGSVIIPGGVFWVYFVGVCFALVAISIFIGKYDKLANFLLGILLLIFTFGVHLPGLMEGDQAQMAPMMKAFAMCGAAWFYARYVASDPTGLGV